MAVIRKQFTITAHPDMMDRFEAFLAMLHYNGGHSGLFAIPFDGDGNESLKIEPPPPEAYKKGVDGVAGTGASVEIAQGKGLYTGQFIDYDRGTYRVTPDGKSAKTPPRA